MAAPVANNWQSKAVAASTGVTLSYTVTSGSDIFLVVGTAAKDLSGAAGATVPVSVTWGGTPLTMIGGVSNTQESGNEEGASLWGLLNPTPGTNDLVVAWSESQTTGNNVFAVYLTGAEQTLPTTLVSTKSSNTDGTNFTHIVGVVPADYLVIDAAAVSGPSSGVWSVKGTGQVLQVSSGVGATPSNLLGSETPVTEDSTVTVGWSTVGGNFGRYAYILAAFSPAAVAEMTFRPTSDEVVGGWTTQASAATNLYAAIDETSADDADYIKSDPYPTSSLVEFGLTNTGYTAGVGAGKVEFRYEKTSDSSIFLIVRLKQGATTISSTNFANVSTAVFQATVIVTQAEVSTITNTNDLRLQFEARDASP